MGAQTSLEHSSRRVHTAGTSYPLDMHALNAASHRCDDLPYQETRQASTRLLVKMISRLLLLTNIVKYVRFLRNRLHIYSSPSNKKVRFLQVVEITSSQSFDILQEDMISLPFDSNLRLQSSLVGESVTGVFPLQEVVGNMYKQYCIYSCLA